jgi:hypothetical protein
MPAERRLVEKRQKCGRPESSSHIGAGQARANLMIVHPSRPAQKRGISKPAAISCSRGIGRTWLRKDGAEVERPSAERAWSVYFLYGYCVHYDVGNGFYVRVVRS